MSTTPAIPAINDESVALQLARKHLEGNLAIFQVEEYPAGWVFFSNLPEFVEHWRRTGEYKSELCVIGGDGPIFVSRWSGQVEKIDFVHFPSTQAAMRQYLETLSKEQRKYIAETPWDHYVYQEPIRFISALINLGEVPDVYELDAILDAIEFTLECDNDLLHHFKEGIPRLKGIYPLYEVPILIPECRLLSVTPGDSSTRFRYRPLYDRSVILTRQTLGEHVAFIPEENWSPDVRELFAHNWLLILGSLKFRFSVHHLHHVQG